MEWALMLFMTTEAGAASELLGTYKTLDECQPIAKELSEKADSSFGRKTYKNGFVEIRQYEINLHYTCAPAPKAYIYQ